MADRSAFRRPRRAPGAKALSVLLPGLLAVGPLPAAVPSPGDDPPSGAARCAANQAEGSQAQESCDGTGADPPVFGSVVTVTASREERDAFDEPVSVEVLDDGEIRTRRQVGNLVDAFAQLAGVSVQKTAQGQGSPYIRGFTGFHNLMLIDGVRLNNSVLRSGPNQYWATVDALSAARVELVRGPAAVLYGSDAVGGTAQLITPSLYPTTGPGGHARGRAYLRWAEGERSLVSRAEIEGAQGSGFSYRLGASFKDHGDFRAGGDTGTVVNSGYDEHGLDAKLQFFPGGDRELTLVVQSFRQEDVPRTETTVFSKPFRGTRVGSELRRDHDQERLLSYLKYSLARPGAAIEEAELTVSYQRTREERIRVRGDARTDVSGFDVGTVGLQTLFRSSTARDRWTYGAEFHRDSVDSFRRDFAPDGSLTRVRIQGPIADDAAYETMDAYVQNERDLAGERLTLHLGGRFSHSRLRAGRVEDPETGAETSLADSWSSLVGSLRGIWRPRPREDRWHLYASVAQAFRAPNLSDVTRLDATSAVETLTPGLEPERYLALETGVKMRSGKTTVTASLFRTFIDDQIVQSPTGRFIENTPEVQKSNVGDGYVQGLELIASARTSRRTRLWGNLSWIEGEVDQFLFADDGTASEVRAPVSRLIPWMANAGAVFEAADGSWWLEVHGTAFARADRLALRDLTDTRRIPPGGTPGFAVLGLRGAVELERPRLTLALGLENLLDEDYRIHGSGQNMPGRNLVVSVEWNPR